MIEIIEIRFQCKFPSRGGILSMSDRQIEGRDLYLVFHNDTKKNSMQFKTRESRQMREEESSTNKENEENEVGRWLIVRSFVHSFVRLFVQPFIVPSSKHHHLSIYLSEVSFYLDFNTDYRNLHIDGKTPNESSSWTSNLFNLMAGNWKE